MEKYEQTCAERSGDHVPSLVARGRPLSTWLNILMSVVSNETVEFIVKKFINSIVPQCPRVSTKSHVYLARPGHPAPGAVSRDVVAS